MRFFLAVFIVFALAISCRKAMDKPTWDVDVIAPLVNTSLNINQLLPEGNLQTNADSSLKIVYSTDIFDIDVDSLFKIPDTTITEIYTVPINLIAAPGDAFYSNDEERELNVSNGVELNYASIESGFIEIEVFNDIREKVLVTYKILSATKFGDTLTLTELIDAGTSFQPGYLKKRIDISNYNLNLTGINGNKTNTLVTKAVASVDTNGSTVNINIGQKIKYINTLKDVVPYYVRGYFGSQSYRFGPESTNFNVFERIIDGTIDIEDIDVNLSFENGIGVDAQLIINQLKTVNTNNGANASLTHSIIGSPININRSTETNSVPEVNYTLYTNQLTTSNSNIDQLIELFPNQLIYDMNLLINPFGNISGSNDFVFKKHPLKTKLNVEFPLSLVANNLTLVDTADFNLEKNSSDKLLEGTLFIYANNGYPFDANLSLELLDENLNPIKSLPISNYIASATVDANLKVSAKKESVLAIPITRADMDDLYRTKKIIVKTAFNTTAKPQFVKIYENYNISIKMVGDFAYQIN